MPEQISKSKLWTARIMSGIVILYMLLDGVAKIIQPKPVVEGTLALGYAEHHILIIGILALISAGIYAIPKTSFLGAVLLTGFWGGAIATHLRMDDPLFSHVLVPFYLAMLAWGGLYLRDKRIRKLFSFQKNEK